MELDQQQLAAVQAPLSDISIMAGAGSGKTRVIVERVKYMIETLGVDPRSILALTYTRRAAKEMQERLQKTLGRVAAQVTTTTIHGFCLLQLERFGAEIGWRPESMSVLSDDDSRRLLDWVLDDLGFRKDGKLKKIKRADIDQAFHVFGTMGLLPNRKESNDLFLIMSEFFNSCLMANTLTYPLIINEFERLMVHGGAGYHAIRAEYQHLIIDEVQDTTELQWGLLRLLRPDTRVTVGDMRQSIFSFAGADPQVTLCETCHDDKLILQSNYRSGAEIVATGNQAMADFVPMVPVKDGGQVLVMESNSESIIRLVGIAMDAGYGFGDIAILCRVHRPLAKCVDALRESGADIYYPKGLAKNEVHPDTIAIHALMALHVNPHDIFAFRAIAEHVGLTPRGTQEIRAVAKRERVSLVEAHKIVTGETLLLDAWIDSPLWSKPITEWIHGNLAEHDGDYANYLRWYAMRDLQANQEVLPANHITALSIHQAKGLQWPCVILIGASEGILPSKMAKTAEEIEEERRLYYVAVTRAESMLIISPRPGEERSRFICEQA